MISWANVGHGSQNQTYPIGVAAELDADARMLRLLDPPLVPPPEARGLPNGGCVLCDHRFRAGAVTVRSTVTATTTATTSNAGTDSVGQVVAAVQRGRLRRARAPQVRGALAANVFMTARPMAPPSSAVVLTSPDASPASLGVAPDIASPISAGNMRRRRARPAGTAATGPSSNSHGSACG